MVTGKVFGAILFLVLFFTAAEACFVTSTLDVQIDQSEQVYIPPNDSVTLTANITLSWGFGAFLPLPVNIYVDVTDVPDWVYASPINSFTITPDGWSGGSESQIVTIKLSSEEETSAFVFGDITVHANTNGSFLVQGSEDLQTLRVAQDFEHRQLVPQLSTNAISMNTGEMRRVYVNLTNRCNADLVVLIEPMNFSSDWSIRMDHSEFIIPSAYTGNPEVSIPLLIEAEDSSEENGWLAISYYPSKDIEWGPETLTISLNVKSQNEEMSGGTIAAVVVGILIVVVIIVLIWRKYRQPQDF